jgi:hypothetical protein
MREASGLGVRGALRCLDTNDILLTIERALLQYARVL